MKNTMQDLIEKIMKHVDMGESNYKRGDVFRTNNCTEYAHGLAAALGLMGIEYDFGTYMDGDFHRVGYVYIDGVTLVKNGEIDWKAYGKAVLDDDHSWGGRTLAIAER